MDKLTNRILLIDDNLDNLTIMEDLIQHAFPGYGVLSASSGIKGLALAASDDPDVILLDVVMPGMSGKALAEELHARWPEIKVLFMSGYPNEVILRHGLMNGEVNYLQKPFTPSEQAAKVREVMG